MIKQLEHLNTIIENVKMTNHQKLAWLEDNFNILDKAYKFGEITLEEKRVIGAITFNYIELISAYIELDNV